MKDRVERTGDKDERGVRFGEGQEVREVDGRWRTRRVEGCVWKRAKIAGMFGGSGKGERRDNVSQAGWRRGEGGKW